MSRGMLGPGGRRVTGRSTRKSPWWQQSAQCGELGRSLHAEAAPRAGDGGPAFGPPPSCVCLAPFLFVWRVVGLCCGGFCCFKRRRTRDTPCGCCAYLVLRDIQQIHQQKDPWPSCPTSRPLMGGLWSTPAWEYQHGVSCVGGLQ